MKKIMQMAMVCLLAMSTAAYAGDNRKSDKSGAGKTCSAQTACKKGQCPKPCNVSCTKEKCSMKKG